MDDTTLVRALLTDAADQVRPVGRPPSAAGFAARRRGHRRTAFGSVGAVAAVALVAAGLTVVSTHGAHRSAASPSMTAPVNPAATADAISHDKWTTLPKAPIAGREGAASVWTGTQMLIWGGQQALDLGGQPLQGSVESDGAAYSPKLRRWSVLPASPLSARVHATAVWTGRSMFIWGGTDEAGSGLIDGALYTPANHTWTKVPTAPLDNSDNPQAVLSGDRVVVISGPHDGNGGAAIHAASYNPSSNTWTRLPDPAQSVAHRSNGVTVLAIGDSVQLWVEWSHRTAVSTRESQTFFGIDSYTLDLAHERWLSNGRAPQAIRSVAAALWTGRQILLPAARPYCGGCMGGGPFTAPGVRLDPTDGSTSEIGRGPIDDLLPMYVWTGAAMLTFNTQEAERTASTHSTVSPGQAAVWDARSNSWYRVPAAPAGLAEDAVTVWTGTSLVIWGEFARYSTNGSLGESTTGLQLG